MTEVVWAFDEHTALGRHPAGPVIDPDAEIIGGVSYIGPDQPAITVDPSLDSRPYESLLNATWSRLSPWRRTANVGRAAFAHTICEVAAGAVADDEDRYQASLARLATNGIVDLGQLLRARAGDNRVRALAAGYMAARYFPDARVRLDGNRVDGVDQFWVRYRSPNDLESYLEPLATVIVNPGQRQASTLLETGILGKHGQYEPGSSPYARPRDEDRLALLNTNRRRYPVVGQLARELGALDYDGPGSAFALIRNVRIAGRPPLPGA